VIHNVKNLGFPAGCNQGFRLAQGRYVVLRNSDTVVCRGWLEGTFKGLGVDCQEQLQNNYDRFQRKWGPGPSISQPSTHSLGTPHSRTNPAVDPAPGRRRAWTPVIVDHTGYQDPTLRQRMEVLLRQEGRNQEE